jgi:hypothetical protein
VLIAQTVVVREKIAGARLNILTSVRTSKRTPHFTITRISWLMLFKETVAVYSEIHTKPRNTKYSVRSLGCLRHDYHEVTRFYIVK